MRHSKALIYLFIVLMLVPFYSWSGQVQAQTNEPYVASSIPVSELGDTTPPGRLNVRFQPPDPMQAGADIRQILQKAEAAPDSLTISGEAVPAITPEIQTLATGLENDPLAIYDYVHNRHRLCSLMGTP